MRLATIMTERGARLCVRASADAIGHVDLADATGDPRLVSLAGLFECGTAGWDRVREAAERTGRQYEQTSLLAPVPSPSRILCLGVNYHEHAVEGGREPTGWPECFVRGAGTVCAPFADLVRPWLTEKFDYEGELGVVIGSGGRYVAASEALDVVAGYVVLNDASARDWQRAGTQWTPGKNFDGSMPIGPEIVTPDELDVSDVALTTTLNCEVMQRARTSEMIVDVPGAIEFFSSFTTLMPGDVIATGTPGGVGFARNPPIWLKPGDVVAVSIEGLGTIRNTVVDETSGRAEWRWRPRS